MIIVRVVYIIVVVSLMKKMFVLYTYKILRRVNLADGTIKDFHDFNFEDPCPSKLLRISCHMIMRG